MNKTPFTRVMTSLLAFVMLFCLLPMGASTASAATTADGYTLITTAEELDTVVRNNLSGKYRLGNDIDLSTYAYNSKTWTSKNGWTGIGTTQSKAFTGTFDGDGYTISGLWSSSAGSNEGFFGWLNGATVTNLTIEMGSTGMAGSGERRGALAGNAYGGTVIDNVHVLGSGSTINGSANYIAGLVGVVYKSSISNSSVQDLTVSGGSYVAGLVGTEYGASSITDSAVLDVNISGKSYVGGFIGYTYESSSVKNSSVENAVVTGSSSYVGGFVGASNKSTYDRNYVMVADVTSGSSYAGGFSGAIYNYSDLTSCYVFDGSTSAKYYAGGHMGTVYGHSTVQKSCSYGDVQTTSGYIAGGFAGEATNAIISNCYAQVDSVSKSSGAGGFIAYSASSTSVYNSYCAGTVTAGSKTNVGAFVGHAKIAFTGTNYYDNTLCSLSAYGTSGTPSGSASAYPQGYNTATMMKQSTFVGWDFNTIWRIDEDETYPYFWDWGWWNPYTLTYDKNAAGAEGEMEPQGFRGTAELTLSLNQFTYEDHVFLGWSTDPAATSIEYTDGQTVTLTEDTTLYAIWGTPDFYYNFTTSPETIYTNDTVTISLTFGNSATDLSTTWYGLVATFRLTEHLEFNEDSVVVTLNGQPITPDYELDPATNTLTISAGDVEPGQEYVLTFQATALPSAEGQSVSVGYNITGSATPVTTRSAASTAGRDNILRVDDEGPAFTVLAPQTDGAF